MTAKTKPVSNDLPASDGGGKLPAHVAIIMDGNGRWAKARGLPRSAGHKRGAEAARKAVRAAAEAGVSYITLFGFSSENWSRPDEEVSDLMGLLRFYLKREIKSLQKDGVRLRVIGNRAMLPTDIQELISAAEKQTENNARITLIIALSYGGRAEIVNAAMSLAVKASEGVIDPSEINEEMFSGYLETVGIPDPDLLIRTSGEKRISNFLLWQTAYSEFIFTDTLWPDFSAEDFDAALAEFSARERRYGKVSG
ncbi:MAG: isoprenyl transferase [Rhodospirillaceae bacterium]|nr:isoprenyl transferase [Rhodospirillaceae bacterium]